MGCHLPCRITQCYLPADTSEHTPGSTPASQSGTRFTYSRRTEGWILTYRDGIPAHRQSPIQVLSRQCTAGNRTHDRKSNAVTKHYTTKSASRYVSLQLLLPPPLPRWPVGTENQNWSAGKWPLKWYVVWVCTLCLKKKRADFETV